MFYTTSQLLLNLGCSSFHMTDSYECDIMLLFFIVELKMVYFLQKAVLFEYGIRRITFLIAQKVIQSQQIHCFHQAHCVSRIFIHNMFVGTG